MTDDWVLQAMTATEAVSVTTIRARAGWVSRRVVRKHLNRLVRRAQLACRPRGEVHGARVLFWKPR